MWPCDCRHFPSSSLPSPPAVVDFFNRVNLMYGTIADFCTDANCPKMSGGPKFEYYWTDGDKYKKPTALTAPKVRTQCHCSDVTSEPHVGPVVWITYIHTYMWLQYVRMCVCVC